MIPIVQIDAFTARAFGGNPAVVVLDAQGLSDAQMQAIATEMRVAGTAYLTPATSADAQWRLRWFTPTREIAYSGHTTLAAVHVLLEAGRLRNDHVVFETQAGRLGATVVADSAHRLI